MESRADVYAFGVLLRALSMARSRKLEAVADACTRSASERPQDGAQLCKMLEHSKWRAMWVMAVLGATFVTMGAALLSVLSVDPLEAQASADKQYLSWTRLTDQRSEAAIEQVALAPGARRLAYVERRGVQVLALDDHQELDQPPGLSAPICVSWLDADALLVSTDAGHFRVVGRQVERLGIDGKGCAHVSPNGDRIAFAHSDGLSVRSMDGNTVYELSSPSVVKSVAWAPDSRQLAYIESTVAGDPALSIIRLDSGVVRELVHDGRLMSDIGIIGLDWRDDRMLVVALAERPALGLVSEVVVSPSDRWQPTVLGSFDGPVSSISARSGRLALLRWQHDSDVHLASLTLEPRPLVNGFRRLTMSSRDERPTDWATDGGGIWIVRADPEGHRMVFVPTDDTLPGLPEIRGASSWPRVFSENEIVYWRLPDGTQQPRAPNRSSLVRLELRHLFTGATRNLIEIDAPETVGTGSPAPRSLAVHCLADQERCVFADLRQGAELFHVNRSGVERIGRVPLLNAPAADFALAHDGSLVALPDSNKSTVLIVSVEDASVVRRIHLGDCWLQYSTFTPDDQALIVSAYCDEGAPYQLLRVPMEGEVTSLHQSHHAWISHPQLSPDGRQLAVGMKHFVGNVWISASSQRESQ